MLPEFLKQRPVHTGDGLWSALCHGIVYPIFTGALVGVTATVPGGRTHRHTCGVPAGHAQALGQLSLNCRASWMDKKMWYTHTHTHTHIYIYIYIIEYYSAIKRNEIV